MPHQITAEELSSAMGLGFAPTEQQWRSISAPLAPAVVIAGAGSGKTTLMAMRVVYLVLTGQVLPEQVLGLTFTTKAAAELRHRIESALAKAGALQDGGGLETIGPTVATYNSYAAGLLVDHGLRIGHEPDQRVIADAGRYQLAQHAILRHRSSVLRLSDHLPTVINQLLDLDGELNEHLVAISEVVSFDDREQADFQRALEAELAAAGRATYKAPIEKAILAIDRRRELLELVASYRRHKSRLGVMDFADQISLAAKLAVQCPEVGAAERARYPVVLLDEYQDTSVSQAKMLAHLFSGPKGAGRGHAVMSVGDPNQAIYGWRGASVSNILRFGDTFPALDEDVPVFALSVNQRSDRRILEAANHLAQPLQGAGAGVGLLEAATGRAPGSIRVNVFESLYEELGWVAAEIKAAHTGKWSDLAVLVRDNHTAAQAFDVFSAEQIPVEIVGLTGLIRLPEVAQVIAMMQLLQDSTANAALLTLLTSTRWAIGPRDLSLLADRAAELAGRANIGEILGVDEQLAAIADGADPADLPALCDALEDPGEQPYSAQALERFTQLAIQIRRLRVVADEPVLDVVRRIIDVTGIDVELASSINPAASARRDNLDHFIDIVAQFRGYDGELSLAALLAYLSAEAELGDGIDLATVSEADSVKLLTVHRAKGLEWSSVFMVGVCETKFPANRARSTWVSSPAVLPGPLRGDAPDLPQLAGHDKAALDDFKQRVRESEALEELRLGYVAMTRAAHSLVVTSHLWSPGVVTPRGPSPYQRLLKELLEDWGAPVDGWAERPDPKVTPNPLQDQAGAVCWPSPERGAEAEVRAEVAALVKRVDPYGADAELDSSEDALVAQWDDEIERLLEESRVESNPLVLVPRPLSMSVSAMGRLAADPQALMADLIRPMPKRPSTSARIGTSFHEWVAHRFQQVDLFDPFELLDPTEPVPAQQDELADLVAGFERGPFASRKPVAVEAPFSLILKGQVIRGRIDAVYADLDDPDAYLVVDWKTGAPGGADPLQLALYRLAWAELAGVDPSQVGVCFHYPLSGESEYFTDLPDRAELAELFDQWWQG
ncbi:MAG: UvrD-helicase domain-containing protein [Nocardioidaceae bacterium]|nr:UvrD-helicase domain-containing protein [Nocardioidaceae bacterium]